MSATAQGQDFMPLRIDCFPATTLTDPPPIDEAGENAEIAFYKISIGGLVPVTQGTTRILIGGRYENLRVDLSDVDGFVAPDNLHYLRADLYMLHRLSAAWTLGVAFLPGIASDLKDLGPDDWRFQGGAMLMHRASDRFGYGLGVALTSDFGTPAVMPLLKVDWVSASNVKVAAMLPVQAYVAYVLNSSTELGIAARVTGTQYNLNVDDYNLLAPNVLDATDLPARYSVLTVGPSFRQRVRGPFFVVGEAGVTLWRRFEFDGEQLNTTLDQDRSLYLCFGIAYRPPFKSF
jgi:hypothetical protein